MVKSKLIILRGNSGSGKTSTAKLLQQELGPCTMLVSQDVVRREILRVKDSAGNPAIQLIYQLCRYGQSIGYTVILEGIFNTNKYGAMLRQLVADFDGNVQAYYFNIPFEEALRRHKAKPNAHDFGETELRKWWKDQDRLGVKGERDIDETLSQADVVAMIVRDTMRHKRYTGSMNDHTESQPDELTDEEVVTVILPTINQP